MDRTKGNLKRKLTDRISPSAADNETITDVSLEHSPEHVANPVLTQAGLVRTIHHFMMIHNILSPVNLNALLKLVELIKRFLTSL